jgi:hypothetical protein
MECLHRFCRDYIDKSMQRVIGDEWLCNSYCIYRHQMACCKDMQYLLLNIKLSMYVLYLCKDIRLANT